MSKRNTANTDADTAATDTTVEVPEDLSTVESTDELTAIEDGLRSAFNQALEDSAPVDELNDLADTIDAVRAEIAKREEVAAVEAEQRQALADRVNAADEPDDDDEVDEGSDDEAEADVDDVEAPGDADGENADETEATADEDTSDEADTKERELVTAGGKRKAASASALTRTRGTRRVRVPDAAPDEGDKPKVTITAAADVPGFSNGADMNLTQVAGAFHDRAAKMSATAGDVPIARIHVPIEHWVDGESDSAMKVDSVLAEVTSQKSLVAAGGWCVPTETLWDFFEIEAADSLFSLPTVGVRASIQWPEFFGFGAADDALWTWTEQDDIDALENDGGEGDVTKPCMRIPCPAFTDPVALEAEGLCVEHGNLTHRAWPDLTARWLRLVVNAHLHRVSNARLAKVLADTESVTISGPSDGVGDALYAVELQVEAFRSRWSMAQGTILELTVPPWLRAAFRASLAMRGGVDLTNVTNQQIDAHWATRGVRVEYVAGYQPLQAVGDDADDVTAYPGTVDALLKVAGSYFAGDGGSLDLGVTRDKSQIEVNDFTAAWSEQFHLVGRRGPQARVITIPLNVNGVTACCEPEGD